jgi:hypothetical protein
VRFLEENRVHYLKYSSAALALGMLCAAASGAQGVFQVDNAIATPGNYISSVAAAQ